MEFAFAYADIHGGIGLTQTKAFNRKFAHWMAENSPWPDYKAEELLRLNTVLNEWDVAPAMVVHDLMIVMKLGRHVKGKFQVSKKAKALASNRGALFAGLAETYLFRYNHARTARSEFTAPGNWEIFLNIINVEAEQGLTEPHLVKTLYGLERQGVYDREYYDHAGFSVHPCFASAELDRVSGGDRWQRQAVRQDLLEDAALARLSPTQHR